VSDSFLAAFDLLPEGTFTGRYRGRRYLVTRQSMAGGSSAKLVAEELGGRDYISLNLYRLRSGVRLKPCEMPREKVVDFVTGLRPEGA
jgi:hypothetical protein